MTIKIEKILAHQISPSILILNDAGKLGVRSVENNIVIFYEVVILEDSASGLWVSGIPENLDLITQGQGFVEDGQKVLINIL
jgi:multidrug efflux system membrane fusion protein